MNKETLDYIKSRITRSDYTRSGEVLTSCEIGFDNGAIVVGRSMCDISDYDKEAAQEAACEDAMRILAPGVEFILSKK